MPQGTPSPLECCSRERERRTRVCWTFRLTLKKYVKRPQQPEDAEKMFHTPHPCTGFGQSPALRDRKGLRFRRRQGGGAGPRTRISRVCPLLRHCQRDNKG